ncbi:MAG: hypothetical protein PWP23_712 [Candidatus Sumerlaeota bacterium]|nr:hypothetical protein [Candidatus Sumerlaeota bacterium]
MDYSWLSILPPLAAIAAALLTRQVVLSLFLGVWMGWTVIEGGNPLLGLGAALAQLIAVFESGYNTKVILFSALVGSLILLTQRSGGVAGFIAWMRSLNIGQTRRGAELVAFVTGIVVFVESSITCLVVGSVARPLTDRLNIAREKLAYICDSTSAPVCILIPMNAWGAYIMGLLLNEGIDHPLGVLARAVPLNFYAWLALGLTAYVIITGRDFGPMRTAVERAATTGKLLRDGAVPMIDTDVIAAEAKPGIPLRKRNMLLPLAVMILMMPIGLYVTGHGAVADKQATAIAEAPVLQARATAIAELLAATRSTEADASIGALRTELAAEQQEVAALLATAQSNAAMQPDLFNMLNEGSGSTAVFWAVLAAIATAGGLYLLQRIMSLGEVMTDILKGAGGLMPMAAIMMLAFAINDTCAALGTGKWVAAATEPFLVSGFVPAVLFGVSCFIAFSTGTSWGTFGIMMPIGVPLALATGVDLPLAVAAIMGGGVFGDHCSPISDTSVVSSMATACDHIDHVRTQLPYALTAAAGAIVLFLIAGFVM